MPAPQEPYEAKLMARALSLTKGRGPAYNIAPVLDLLRQADRLGFDVATLQQPEGARGMCQLSFRPLCSEYPRCQCGQTLAPVSQGGNGLRPLA